MILNSYPYAAPPVRLQERADDGGIRLRLTLRRGDFAGFSPSSRPSEVVETDPRIGFSDAGAKLLELAPGVRGQLVGGAVPTILGALADFTGATPDAIHRARAESLAAQTANVMNSWLSLEARHAELVAAALAAAGKLEATRRDNAANIAQAVASDLRRAAE